MKQLVKITLIVLFVLVSFVGLQKSFFKDQSPKVLAEQIKLNCASDKNNCYAKEFKTLAGKEDFSKTVETLVSLQALDADAKKCHTLSHVISGSAVRQNPDQWKELIKNADLRMEACSGGFLHGIVEGYMATHPEFEVDSSFIEKTCNELNGIAVTACAHGFGHILFLQADGRLANAAKNCEAGDLKSECFKGLFMEDAFRTMLVEHGLAQEAKDPTKDAGWLAKIQSHCFDFAGDSVALESCWANLGHIFSEFYKNDERAVFEACGKASSEKASRRCYFLAVSSLAISDQFAGANIHRLCKPYQLQKDVYELCVKYIVATLIYHSADFANQAVGYCNEAATKKGECFEILGSMLARSTDLKKRPESCNGVPVEYKDLCLSGNPTDPRLFRVF